MTTNENSPKEEEKKEPENLYKYRSFNSPYINSVLDGIAKDEIYFSCPTEFNDPFDTAMLIDNDIYLTNDKKDKKFEPFFHSLTTHNDNLLMWSHYSDSHKGFCIEYNNMKNSHDDFDMQKVSYKEIIPEINPNNVFGHQTLSDSDKQVELDKVFKDFIEAYYTKSDDWKYEEEWRLRYYPTYGYINIFIYCILYDTFSKQPEKTTNLIKDILKEHVDSDQVIKNDEKYTELKNSLLKALNSSKTIKDNEELLTACINLFCYLYNKQNRTFDLKQAGLETTAIYLGMEVENNSIEILPKIIKLLKIAQEKELKVYTMQRDKIEIDVVNFINKLQSKIDALKNAQTLEKMKRNLQP